MPSSTRQAFVHHGSWDQETREYPAMKWMEDYTKNVIDGKAWEKGTSPDEHHTPDFTLYKSDGTIIKGADAAWKELSNMYGPFAKHKHDPTFLVTFESEDGWEMIGEASLYFNLHGGSGDAVTDPQGEKWDGVGPGAFHFSYKKEESGIKLKWTKIRSDPSPALKLMLKAGHLNGEQLAGMLSNS